MPQRGAQDHDRLVHPGAESVLRTHYTTQSKHRHLYSDRVTQPSTHTTRRDTTSDETGFIAMVCRLQASTSHEHMLPFILIRTAALWVGYILEEHEVTLTPLQNAGSATLRPSHRPIVCSFFSTTSSRDMIQPSRIVTGYAGDVVYIHRSLLPAHLDATPSEPFGRLVLVSVK